MDLVVRGGTVLDGSGGAPRVADVAVADGRIAFVGDSGRATERTVDARGLIVAPGLIDMHSHADLTLPAYGEAVNSLAQGVTTEVVGNCGFSPAPVIPERLDDLREHVRGFGPRLDWSWRTVAEYLAVLEERGIGVNVAPLVGHSALRIGAMGMAQRPATDGEIASMRVELTRAIAEGAWGMSSGLVYPPGAFADTDELAALAAELRSPKTIYATHVRNEAHGLLPAVDEALEVGARAGVAVHVSHLKAAGRLNWGGVSRAIERLDAARRQGLEVSCDFYPYTAASTLLRQLVPPWAHEGGVTELVARLRSAEVRARIRLELEQGLPGWSNHFASAGGWDRILVAATRDPALSAYESRSIADSAAAEGKAPLDLCCDILIRDGAATTMILFAMSDQDVDAVMRYPNAAVGSDSLGVVDENARVHPRAYGTFARVLAWSAREEGAVLLPEMVRRMTDLPARILGMRDRGRIARGHAADIVVFDPRRIADRATYAHPNRLADGVAFVLVNGALAVEERRLTRIRAGRVLRKIRKS